MIDWKRLVLPNIEKIIVLIIIFYLFGIYLPWNATCNDCNFVKLGIPYTFNWIGSGNYQSEFSFSYLILDLVLLYIFLSLSFYHKFIKLKEKDTNLNKVIKFILNLFIGLVIFIIMFYAYLIFTEDILDLDDLLGFR